MNPPVTVRPLALSDRDWVRRKMVADWGAEIVVAHGCIFRPAELPGFIAEAGTERVGLLTYHIDATACEVVTINSWKDGLGVGSLLIEAAKQAAPRQAGCTRLWLITTNDNTGALRFYQKRGLTLAAIHINAIEASRRLEPEIPLTGEEGIPIRDEIELEIQL